MVPESFRQFVRHGIAAVLILAVGATAYGDRYWMPDAPGAISFFANNWYDIEGMPQSAPAFEHIAYINSVNGLDDTVYIDGIANVHRLVIGGNQGPSAISAGGLELREGALLVTENSQVSSIGGTDGVGYVRVDTGAAWYSAGRVYVGDEPGSKGYMTQHGGLVELASGQPLSVGQLAGAYGRYVMDGGELTIGDRLFVGSIGEGEFEMNGGAITLTGNNGYLTISRNGGTGTFILNDGTVSVNRHIEIGHAGNGTFTLNGGTVTLQRQVEIGREPQGSGTLNIHGGTLSIGGNNNAGFLQVARQGEGYVNHTGGQVFINRISGDAGFTIQANNFDTTGEYRISGGELHVADTNRGIDVGNTDGTGRALFNVVGDASTITIGNDYRQRPAGILDLDIDTGITTIDVGRDAVLSGRLDVEFLGAPTIGETFTIMQYAGSLTGTFDVFDTLVNSSLGLDTVQLGIDYGTGMDSAIVLTVLDLPPPSATLQGDYNGDGVVDAADYTVWRNSMGQTGLPPFEGADGDGDGNITAADYTVWKDNFGSMATGVLSLPATQVPEPGTLLLIASGLAFAWGWRRQGRSRGDLPL